MSQTVPEPSSSSPSGSKELERRTSRGGLEHLLDDELTPLFWAPQRIDKPSAWFGHVPFAHWLVTAARPRLLVELGTHAGVSYAAFCEANLRAGSPARCFAVDTWKGDKHAGFYPEETYVELKRFNDARYSQFSTLLRATFDEALGAFEDGSVDLLHIDGLHTYDAVRHDFETWLPKLSNRAVVLFHDTNEKNADFGVWRLWAELSKLYPSLEFLHSHGLGILCVGREVPTQVFELCTLDEPAATVVRERFEHLGQRWAIEYRLSLVANLAEERRATADSATAQEAVLAGDLARAREQIRACEEAVAAATAKLEATEMELEARLRSISEIHRSTSWRVTKPLRAIKRILSGRSR